MMRAAVVTQKGKLEIKEIPIPDISSREILVKIEVTGVCHTDIHVIDQDIEGPVPIVPGHEGVGRIVKKGNEVPSELNIGDLVCIPWLNSACQDCFDCDNSYPSTCLKRTNTGFTVDGTFAEYAKADFNFVGRIPEGLMVAQAAPITCAGLTVYKGLLVSHVKHDGYVVITGAAGGLGHLAIQYAKYMKMKVIGVDIGQHAMDFMKKLGCDYCIDAQQTDVPKKVMEITGVGSDAILELVPSVSVINQGMDCLRNRGTVVLIALAPGDFAVNTVKCVVNAIKIRGSIVGNKEELEEALKIAAHGYVKCQIEKKRFDDVNEVINDMRHGKIKGRVVLMF